LTARKECRGDEYRFLSPDDVADVNPDQKERYLASLKDSYPEAYQTAYIYSDTWYFILRQKASLERYAKGGEHYVFKRGELDQIAASSLRTLIWAGAYEQET
jgi:hypothetical protein